MFSFQTTACPEELAPHAPDAHCVARDAAGAVAAQCSLWWSEAPSLPGERVGVIGHYSCTCLDGTRFLLENAAQRLAEEGCTLAIGPMDGNTWRRYRLVTERGGEPAFLMEPEHPAEWPAPWAAAGFAPLAQFFSALGTDLAREDAQISRAGERLRAAGIAVRALRADDFTEELRRIHAVSAEAFAGNFLYTPLPEAEFLAQYAAVRERVRPATTTPAARHIRRR